MVYLGHHTDSTPYGPQSPWTKHLASGGQLLYIGTTLINSGTSLHAVEDAIGWKDFRSPFICSRTFPVELVGGRKVNVVTKIAQSGRSAQRKCDGLIPLLEAKVRWHVNIGEAPSLLVDASLFKSVLLEEYRTNGVTMYTPEGA